MLNTNLSQGTLRNWVYKFSFESDKQENWQNECESCAVRGNEYTQRHSQTKIQCWVEQIMMASLWALRSYQEAVTHRHRLPHLYLHMRERQ